MVVVVVGPAGPSMRRPRENVRCIALLGDDATRGKAWLVVVRPSGLGGCNFEEADDVGNLLIIFQGSVLLLLLLLW